MENLMKFEGKQVEVVQLEDKVLFNPYDVGECLDLTDSAVRKAIANMNDKQAIKLLQSDVKDIHNLVIPTSGRLFLTESGVYKLIFQSRKPKAEQFSDWVTDEVLPSIRKYGYYSNDNKLNQRLDKLEKNINDLNANMHARFNYNPYDYDVMSYNDKKIWRKNQFDKIKELSIKHNKPIKDVQKSVLGVIYTLMSNVNDVDFVLEQAKYNAKNYLSAEQSKINIIMDNPYLRQIFEKHIDTLIENIKENKNRKFNITLYEDLMQLK